MCFCESSEGVGGARAISAVHHGNRRHRKRKARVELSDSRVRPHLHATEKNVSNETFFEYVNLHGNPVPHVTVVIMNGKRQVGKLS